MVVFILKTGLFNDFDVAGVANQDLPCGIIACGNAGDVTGQRLSRHGVVGQFHSCEVGIAAGTYHDVRAQVLAVLNHLAVGVVLALRCKDGLSVGVGEGDILDGHQTGAVAVHVALERAVELYGCHDVGIHRVDAAQDFEVVVPYVLRHTADAVAVVGCTQLGLLAVAADVEALEVDQDFLADGQESVHAALIDGDDDAACGVLQAELLIDITAHVVARHVALNLDVVRDKSVLVGVGKYVGIFVDELLDGDDVGLLDAIVAKGCIGQIGLVPVAVLAGSKQTAKGSKYKCFQIRLHTLCLLLLV